MPVFEPGSGGDHTPPKEERDSRGRQESTVALVGLYQVDRADKATLMNAGLAIMGAAAAYSVGTIAFADKFGVVVSWGIVALLPIPLWIISAYQSLLACASAMRITSSIYLGNELYRRTGLPAKDAKIVGVYTSEQIMDFRAASAIHKLTIILSFGGVNAVIMGYTVYILLRTSTKLGPAIWFFAAFYLIFSIVVLASWSSGLKKASANWRTATL
ncbi:MAG: hypothetical protein ACRDSH_13035 [Pseudonocardiaceae bacterium]